MSEENNEVSMETSIIKSDEAKNIKVSEISAVPNADGNANITFERFCEENKDKIMEVIRMELPPSWNKMDYRNNISDFVCDSLEKSFPEFLRHEPSSGYDMIFMGKLRISIKTQRGIFQEPSKKSSRLLSPKSLVMKNCLGGNIIEKTNFDCDYLLAIQRGTRLIGFGEISKKKLIKYICTLEKGKDQIKVLIRNNEYEYFSGLKDVDVDSSLQEELDKIVIKNKSLLYEEIRNKNSFQRKA